MEVRTEYKGKKVGDWIKNLWGNYKILEFLPDDKVRIKLYYDNGNGILVEDKLNPDGYVGKIENYDWEF